MQLLQTLPSTISQPLLFNTAATPSATSSIHQQSGLKTTGQQGDPTLSTCMAQTTKNQESCQINYENGYDYMQKTRFSSSYKMLTIITKSSSLRPCPSLQKNRLQRMRLTFSSIEVYHHWCTRKSNRRSLKLTSWPSPVFWPQGGSTIDWNQSKPTPKSARLQLNGMELVLLFSWPLKTGFNQSLGCFYESN